MIQLTPLEETTAVREIAQASERRGEKRGILVGQITAYQRMLGLRESTLRQFSRKSLEELKVLAEALEVQVKETLLTR